MPLASSIDEVIDQLDVVISESREAGSRLGYFAALYRAVTVQVREDVRANRFEDGPRMERLDVIFANRYLAALDRFRAGEQTPASWKAAFVAANDSRPIVLQHLLVGMNAHINYDLGIAAAEACGAGGLADLKADFYTINQILRDMTESVQGRLTRIWPALEWLDLLGSELDEAVIHFSLERARDAAWGAAQRLAALDESARRADLERLDLATSLLAHVVLNPGSKMSLAATWIRFSEGSDVRRLIDHLR